MQSSKVGTIDKSLLEEAQKYSQHVVNGLNEAVTQFHAVNHCKERLAHAGYTEIREMYVLSFLLISWLIAINGSWKQAKDITSLVTTQLS